MAGSSRMARNPIDNGRRGYPAEGPNARPVPRPSHPVLLEKGLELQHAGSKKRKSRKPTKMKNPRKFPDRNNNRGGDKPKIDNKMKKLFSKRARDYHSSSDDEPQTQRHQKEDNHIDILETPKEEDKEDSDKENYDDDVVELEDGGSDDEDDTVQPGITKFLEGCRAFKMAFTTITKKNARTAAQDVLGPVLSGHKKLIAEKLAEEESERVVKSDAKKEKHLLAEKGHVQPANFLDAHEKFLIGVATKGAVKLFNAVSKAQNAQKGLNPSRSKDAKALGKRRKDAFFTELRKKQSEVTDAPAMGADGPNWAPLRDSYMLTNSKLKNWDKMPVDGGDMDETKSYGSSSDDE